MRAPRQPPVPAVVSALLVVTAGLTAGAALWALSFPTGSPRWGLVALGLAAPTLALTAGVVLVAASRRRFEPALLVVLLLAVAVPVAGRLELPLLARFAAARPGFENAIVDRGEAGPGSVCPTRVGTYRVLACRTVGSDTLFEVRGAGFLGVAGFAYLPEGPGGRSGTGREFAGLGGPWFSYVEEW